MSQSARWCFTSHDPTVDDRATLYGIACRYMCYGDEIAPSTGRPHLQGYVVMSSNHRLAAMKKKFPDGTHLEVAKGSTEQNITYCKKEGTFYERGTAPITAKEKGEKNAVRFKEAFAAAKEGRFDDIPEDIRLRYYSTIKTIFKDHMPTIPDLDTVCGEWYVGPSGSGKSRNARINYPKSYMKMCNKWWDGYQGQESVIIDDLDKNHACLGHHLKIWSDHYAFLAETKGGVSLIRPKQIIVTTQYQINEIFEDAALVEALSRRFKIVEFQSWVPGVINNAY